MTKSELREAIIDKLAAMTSAQYSQYNAAIHRSFFELESVRDAISIMIYHSIGYEVETVSIIQELLAMGKTVSLPVCTPSRNLIAGLVTDLDHLVTVRYGLKEPEPVGLQSPRFIDLIVVPGLAFDERGYRLGRGAGYYDRFLSGQPGIDTLGLAYDFQVFPQIPAETHDIRIKGLVTPAGFRQFL